MNIGDKVSRIPETVYSGSMPGEKKTKRAHTGTVVYIHPQRRYYTVEFEMNGGKVRESYSL